MIRFSDPAPIAPAIGGDPTAPQVYGIGEARFDRHFKNGQARQWNLFIERSLFRNWMASIGYTASVSRNLFNRSYPIQNLQSLAAGAPGAVAPAVHRQQRHAEPGDAAGAQPVPAGERPLLPFAGALGAATIARQNTLFPYPLLIGSNAAVDRSGATADYHAMVLRVSRRFADGMMMDATYTWSKDIDNTDNMEDNQGFNAGGGARGNNHSLTDPKLNRRLGYSDVPHRLVGDVPLRAAVRQRAGAAGAVGGAAGDRRRLAGRRLGDLADRLPDRRHRRERRRGADAPRPG